MPFLVVDHTVTQTASDARYDRTVMSAQWAGQLLAVSSTSFRNERQKARSVDAWDRFDIHGAMFVTFAEQDTVAEAASHWATSERGELIVVDDEGAFAGLLERGPVVAMIPRPRRVA